MVAVSPGGVAPETGREIAVASKVGEMVSFGRYRYAGVEFESGAVKILIMRDNEVLLAREPGTFQLEIHDNDPRKAHEKGLTCEHCPVGAVNSEIVQAERERLRQARAAEHVPAVTE